MDDVHGAHRTTSIVENPFLLVAQVLGADLLLHLGNDEFDDRARVIAVGLDCALREVVQVLWVEDVELFQACVEEAEQRSEKGEEDGEEAKVAQGEAAAATGLVAGGGL